MKSINILAVSNGVGITRDVKIIKDVLTQAGYDVEANHCFRFRAKKRYDLNIFLERFFQPLFALADKNIMIPNQEWFEPGWIPVLPSFDTILTKTIFATDVFKELGCRTEYIGFTSDDRYIPEVKKDDFHWLHLAGKSIQKQTEIVIKTWENNPGFPHLTIIQDPQFYKPRPCLRNVSFLFDRVPEQLLKTLQNTCSVHVCPSETEGFGHYIVEAMSTKGIVLTTYAPPMTELVTSERGSFVKSVRQEPMKLSIKFIISPATLEKAVINLLITEDSAKRKMGEKAREFFLDNDIAFRRRLTDTIGNILS